MASSPSDSNTKRSRFREGLRNTIHRFKHTIKTSSQPEPPTSPASHSPLLLEVPLSTPSNAVVNTHILPSTQIGENTIQSNSGNSNPPATRATPELSTGENAIWRGLDASLRFLQKTVGAFSPLGAILQDLVDCLDIFKAASTNFGGYEDIASELTAMAKMLDQYSEELHLQQSSDSIEYIMSSIKTQIEYVNKRRCQDKARPLLESVQEAEDIVLCYRTIESLFRQLQNNICIRSWRTTNKQLEMTLLRGMLPEDDAKYNSGYSTAVKRRGCTAETREEVLQEIRSWAQDPTRALVYWMSGMAGTGKTTIAYSLCKWFEDKKQLGASFFCSRTSSSCRNVDRIIPTIAYQLARYSPAFRWELCRTLENDPDASSLDPVRQFEKLLREPLLATRDAIPNDVVIVIDALDECRDDYGMRVILEILLKFGPELPLKYFITSRPEPAISNLMISSENYSPLILYLHDIEQSIVEEDIRKYLKEAFQAMHPHPSEDQINCLAKRAGKLFIYAATVVRYILPDRMAVDPNARLTAMLAADPHSRKVQGPSKMYRELDALYTTILSTAFDRDIMEQRELEDMELMMRSIICSKEPVTCQTLSGLFGLTEQRVLSALRPLRSVLHISEDAGIISTLHASFPEYVLDQHRAGEFYCSEEQQDQVLASRCFVTMIDQLRFNICGLETSYAFDSDLVDLKERFSKYVSPALVYSCRYWSEHLQPTEASNVLSGMLAEFLSSRLLFWIEVLNLGKYIRTAPSILNIARRWSKAYGNMAEITQQLTDAWNFVNRFTASTCSLSTPHIYVSALPFCPKSSSVYRNYWPLMKGILDIKGTALKERPQPTLGTLKLDSSALSVAFSYDGTRIASGFDDGTIRVWDTHTRAIVLAPFEAHIRSVLSVVFSPDDTLIVSCSDDCNIQVWDAYKGTLVAGPFDSHTRPVVSVSFSSDNTHIASGSLDCTIRIWNARTGVAVFGPFHNATPITAVEFSPDGSSIAAGSDDCAIRIWDVRTGTAIIGPLRGHAGPIRCIVFSRDGVYAVTGSDDHSIQVWDAHTGTHIYGPFTGHTDSIRSVSISPDNGYIVSGSHDCTIRIWDMAASAASSTLFGVHDRSVMAVAFSPDGALIVSGSSDRTIRVWDASVRGSPPNSPQKTKITSLAISPNGNYICSGSSDLAIRVWCAQTGSLVYGPWSGHTSRIQAVAFSLDCGRTVSGDTQGFIKIWDLNTSLGAIVSFQTYTDPIRAIAFSPEGDQIVSDFGSKGIWLWDAVTGVPCRSSLIMEGHMTPDSPNSDAIVTSNHAGLSQQFTSLILPSWWPQQSHSAQLPPLFPALRASRSFQFPYSSSSQHSESSDSIDFSSLPFPRFPQRSNYISSLFPSYSDFLDFQSARKLRKSTPTLPSEYAAQSPPAKPLERPRSHTFDSSRSMDKKFKTWAPMSAIAVSHNGSSIVVGRDMKVELWDPWNRSIIASSYLQELKYRKEISKILHVSFSSDDASIFIGFNDCSLFEWDISNNSLELRLDGKQYAESSNMEVAYPEVRDPRSVYINRALLWNRRLRTADLISLSADNMLIAGVFDGSNIHVAELGEHSGGVDRISGSNSWIFRRDGWIIDQSTFRALLWVPPDLHSILPPFPVRLSIRPQGSVYVDSWDLYLGEKWAQCFARTSS